MKILLGVSPVGGHLAGIQYGLKKLGIESDLVYYKNNKYEMPSNTIIWKEGFSNIEKVFSMYNFLKFANNYYDIIHFVFGSSFFMFPKHVTFLDLPFISKDIKIFTSFNGCDIRQKNIVKKNDFQSACYDDSCGNGSCGLFYDRLKHIKCHQFNKYSHKTFVTTPDLKLFSPNSELLFQPKHTFYEYDYIGITNHKKLKIVHAPSNATIKGTSEIISACRKLKNKVELILIQNLPNTEALKIYQEADIVIDQLKIGWYGGFAVEVMRMGKPVISYISDTSFSFIDDSLKNSLPIINANIYNIDSILSSLIAEREILQQISEKSYQYVNTYHDPIKIASKLYNDYKG